MAADQPSTVVPGEARRAALQRGAEAEAWVAERLRLDGWDVLARNWHGGGGELDVVACRARKLRFVEVKARAAEDATGADAVDGIKQDRLVRAAEAWMQDHPDGWDEAAFLVAVVSVGDGGFAVEWFDDAFDGA